MFAWDPEKARTNEAKHGVSFWEASSVFLDPRALTFPDPDHSSMEVREISIGFSNKGRVLFVSHCDRNDKIRIISARPATPKERHAYAEIQE